MNWYKQSQLEPNWWKNFYHHLERTADFVLNDFDVFVDSNYNNSFINDQKAIFVIKANYDENRYSIRIQLEFSEKLDGSIFRKDDERSMQGVDLPAEKFLGSKVMVVNSTKMKYIGQQNFPPDMSAPVSLIEAAKNIILNDINL